VDTLERFLGLLFGAIIVGLLISNPSGIRATLEGFAAFSERTVRAFTQFRGGG
jgi:hypothetical protein